MDSATEIKVKVLALEEELRALTREVEELRERVRVAERYAERAAAQ